MELFDTHTHLDLPEFQSDLKEVLQRAGEKGVEKLICVGTTHDSTRDCIQLARQFPQRIYAAAGLHPNYCCESAPNDFERIAHFAQHREIVAIGETGLDFYRDYCDPDSQKNMFRRHIKLSLEIGKPLIIHARKADEQVLQILEEEGKSLHGVRHCFDGSSQIAARYFELGFHIALGGIITRPGHKKIKAAVAQAPGERLLLETDCPYLSPHQVKAGRNEPAFIAHVLDALADIRQTAPEEMARLTTRNANRLFLGET
ncbi:MAG: TatD family hydrolase [Planctomycetes bacterium]|nr:TatD family hydrolase [Planctomycetota bacterium]